MANDKGQGLLKGAAILSVSTIIVKAVGLLFSIPLANLLDTAAFGYYSIAYEIFGFFNAAATAGLPVAVSRMISSAYAKDRKKQADRIFSVAIAAFFVLGLVCSLVMFFFSKQFAALMNMPGANYSIKALAPTVFFCAIMSAIRGYFQGRTNMMPTAISQIIEALTKMLIGISLATYVMAAWQDGELAAAAAIVGVSFSACLGMIFLLIYKKVQKSKDKHLAETGDLTITRRKDILGSLVKFAVPITIGSSFLYALNIVDASIINGGLKSIASLLTYDNETLYGMWGSTLKIFDLPGAIVIALSTSLLPVLTAAFTRKETSGVRKTATISIRITFLITIPCTLGFIIFSEPLANLFYFNNPVSAQGVGQLLWVVAPAVIFNGMLYTTNAIMQSLGKVNRPVINMAICGVIKIVSNYFLVRVPEINIAGAAISTTLSYFINMILNLIAVYQLIPKIENPFRMVLPILLSTGVMGVAAYFSYEGLCMLLPSKISLIAAIIVAVAVYGLAAIVFKAVRASDLRMMPKGDKLVRLFRLYEGRHYE